MTFIKIIKSHYTRFLLNTIYALFNCSIGLVTHSWWFITVGTYYIILAVNRYSVLQIKKKANGGYDTEMFARRITGILLIVLSFCIIGVNILCAIKERGTKYHEIIMIAIATYTFTKITFAIIKMVKAKHSDSPAYVTLRNISLADACVSIYTMQRSMLQSFPGLNANEILIFNILTGSAVWLTALLLGINLIGGKYTDMAKSKIIKTNEKIAQVVTKSYKKIENGVVKGYKKIENGVVSGYTKIEDKFVDTYLTKDNETVEEAKARLKNKK